MFYFFFFGFLFVAVTLYLIYCHFFLKSSLPLPPFGSPSKWEVLKARSTQKGILRVEQVHQESLKIRNTPYGALFRLRAIPLLTTEQIIVTDYKLARIVFLGNRERQIPEAIKSNVFQTMNLIDRSISNIFTAKSKDPERERARKFIAPAFSNMNLQKIAPLLVDNIKEVFKLLDLHERKNQTIEMGQVVLDLIIGTLTKSSFEVEFNLSMHPQYTNSESIDSTSFIHELEILVKERIMQLVIPFRRYLFWNSSVSRAALAQKRVGQVAQRVLDIYRSKHPPKEDSTQRMDYIIDRIVAHSYPSDKHRMGEILTFILAGHETSTNTLTFLLYELARNPEKQKKLQQELDEHITPETCPDGHPTLNQVTKLEYLNNCLRESMRLWPTAAAAGRTAVEDIEYEGMVIPKGRVIQLNFYSMFRQPWINKPDEFIPERWSDQSNPQQLNDLKEMFMPFALGHRNCIGQNLAMLQLRILSANFFKYFEFELVSSEEVNLEIALLMKIERLEMRVRRRRIALLSSDSPKA